MGRNNFYLTWPLEHLDCLILDHEIEMFFAEVLEINDKSVKVNTLNLQEVESLRGKRKSIFLTI